MAEDALQSEVERLKAENAALKAQAARGVSIKVSEKGGVSVYGLGRFPVTLYKEQWKRLLEMSGEIRAFLDANDAQLKAKGDDKDKGPQATPAAAVPDTEGDEGGGGA